MVGEPVTGSAEDAGQVVAYAPLSSADARADLVRQVGRVMVSATGQRLPVSRVVTGIGTCLSSRRYGRRAEARRACGAMHAAATGGAG